MWYWLHKNTHNPFRLWLYLSGFIVVVHAILFFILFFIYRDGIAHLTFVITPTSMRRPIEFRIAGAPIKKPAAQGSKGVAVPSKKVKAPSIHKTTTSESKKKSVPQKQTVSKESKPVAKKETPPVEVPVVPKVTPPVMPELPVAQQEPLAFEIAAQQGICGLEQEYAALGEELTAHWAPPPGVPSDCKCTITIAIDRQGVIAQMAVDASSGMLIYDLAAQSAISELHFPRIAWGKSITITFTV